MATRPTAGGKRSAKAADLALSMAQQLLSTPLGAALTGPEAPESAAVHVVDLRTRGYAFLAPGLFLNRTDERRIVRAIDREYKEGKGWLKWGGPKKAWLYDRDKAGARWLKDIGARRGGRGGIKEAVQKLTADLKKALPDEKFELHRVDVRVTDEDVSEAFHLHLDKGYLTATYVFGEGPATVLYERGPGGQRISRQAPPGSAAVLSGRQREAALGIPATIHSAPMSIVRHRRFVQIIYRSAKPVRLTEAFRRRANARIKAAAKPGEAYLHFSPTLWGDYAPTYLGDLRVK